MKKTAREILKQLYESAFENSVKSSYMIKQNPYGIDQALTDLSELVMGEQKEGEDECYGDKGRVYYSEPDKAYNQAITDISKLFATDKEEK